MMQAAFAGKSLLLALFLSASPTAMASSNRCKISQAPVVATAAAAEKNEFLTGVVDSFLVNALGEPNNGNTPQSELEKVEGRRQINWDAGIVPFEFPGNFFASVVDRGLTVTAKGDRTNALRVSNPPDGSDDKFNSVNLEASKDFQTFSPERLFTSIKSTTVSATFTIPGDNKTEAYVKGFGAIFVDVNKRGSKMTLIGEGGCELHTEKVPIFPGGLSFVGVLFNTSMPLVKEVRFELGNTPLAWTQPERKGRDFVVMDDFFYSEPVKPMKKKCAVRAKGSKGVAKAWSGAYKTEISLDTMHEKFDAKVTLRNKGAYKAEKVKVKFYASRDTTFGPLDRSEGYLGQVRGGGIDGSSYVTIEHKAMKPTWRRGKRYIIAAWSNAECEEEDYWTVVGTVDRAY